jgi:nucleotidyltransferase substrate binding protein (TIGR01987 family)
MERIAIRFKVFNKALNTLEFPLNQLKTPLDQEVYKVFRDSLIQRFEYTYETCLQFFKQILEDQYNITTAGTRDIFREALRAKLITEQELEVLLAMILDRNQTSHAYKEAVAQRIAQDINQYYKTMKAIAQRLGNSLSTEH